MAPGGPYAVFLLGGGRPLGLPCSSFQAQPACPRAEMPLSGVSHTPDPPGSKSQASAKKHVHRFVQFLVKSIILIRDTECLDRW